MSSSANDGEDADQVGKVLRSIDPDQIPLPDGLHERVWARVDETTNAEDSAAHHIATTHNSSDTAGENLAPTIELQPRTDGHETPNSRALPWVAALILVAAAIFGASRVLSTGSPSELSTAQSRSTNEEVEEVDLGQDEGPAIESEELAFQDAPAVTATEPNALALEFSTTQDSVYNATLWQGGEVVGTTGGSTIAGDVTEVRFVDLIDSTPYEIEVILIGPPTVRSGRVALQTAGTTPLQISDLENDDDQVEITFSTNLCAQTSFVVLDADNRTELVRSDTGTNVDCSTRHSLSLDTLIEIGTLNEYIVVIEAEAQEQGEPTGNRSTETITITRGTQ